MSKCRSMVAGALVLAGVFASGTALANHGANVQWSVTIGGPVGVPVYLPPSPVHVRPAPIYAPPMPVYVQPYPTYRGEQYYRPQPPHRYHPGHPRWDRDGDGIPNRHDRVYNPRWDVDGDGIPNRHDRHDDRHWRR
ncbi:MAG: hypothetical protein HY855_21675 [Burkholderiales bacterium]|nr:hypothetical protein [Burkholderiales bacterium]